MFYALKNDTFFRQYGHIGYVENQRNGAYLFLNETAALFLSHLNRIPRSIETIIDEIEHYFSLSRESLYVELNGFFDVLKTKGFLSASMSFDDALVQCSECHNCFSCDSIPVSIGEWIRYTGHQLKWVQLDLTTRCNENCIHCYIPSRDRKTDVFLSLEMIKSLIDDLKLMGVLGINLSGGEVFIREDLFDIITYCRTMDMEISLLSNLSILPSRRITELKDLNLKEIQVSMYSMDPKIHDAITRRSGSLNATINSVRKLTENGIPVSISCPIMKQNQHDFISLYDFAQSTGCRLSYSYALIGKTDLSETNLLCRLSEEELSTAILAILDKDPKLILSRNVGKDERMDLPICGAGINSCQIAPDGSVHICSGYTNQSCGNINEKPLNVIWDNAPLLQKIRNLTWSKMSSKCSHCDSQSFCYPCFARNGNEEEYNAFHMCSYTCSTARCIHNSFKKAGYSS